MKKLLLLFFFLFASNALAESCKIEMFDLTEKLQSAGNAKILSVSNLTDVYSNEPIRRYVQLLSDGSIVVIEQKHCLIYNLTITVLLPEGLPLDKVALQLSSALNKTKYVRQKQNNQCISQKVIETKPQMKGAVISHMRRIQKMLDFTNEVISL